MGTIGAPVKDVAEVARATHRRRPVHRTLGLATELVFRLWVNDAEVSL